MSLEKREYTLIDYSKIHRLGGDGAVEISRVLLQSIFW